MRAIEPARWDDIALAVLLLLIGIPEAVLSVIYDRPIDAQGALSIVCVMLALTILIWRNGRAWRKSRSELEQQRSELEQQRSELEQQRSELEQHRPKLEQPRSELEQHR